MSSLLFLSTLSLLSLTTGAWNLTAILQNSGCNKFSELITKTGVNKIYDLTAQKGKGFGLTIFAPSDDAIKEQGAPDLSTLSNADLVTLLQYHAVPNYIPKAAFKNMTSPLKTLASNLVWKYELTVKTDGDNVTVKTDLNSSMIVATAADEQPLSVYVIDRILKPEEIFKDAVVSPPAPAPGAEWSNVSAPGVPKDGKKSGAGEVEVAGILRAMVAVVVYGIVTVFLS